MQSNLKEWSSKMTIQLSEGSQDFINAIQIMAIPPRKKPEKLEVVKGVQLIHILLLARQNGRMIWSEEALLELKSQGIIVHVVSSVAEAIEFFLDSDRINAVIGLMKRFPYGISFESLRVEV